MLTASADGDGPRQLRDRTQLSSLTEAVQFQSTEPMVRQTLTSMNDKILVIADVPAERKRVVQLLLAEFGDYLVGSSEFAPQLEFRFRSASHHSRFMEIWNGEGLARSLVYVRWSRKYNDTELLQAPLLLMMICRRAKGYGGPTYGTRYDFSAACRLCGTGARQISHLVLRPSSLEKQGDLTSTLDGETLISNSLAQVLQNESVSGIELRPIDSIRPEKPVRWVQLLPSHTLPRMSQESRGVLVENQCAMCRRDGHFQSVSAPEQIKYNRNDLEVSALPDVVQTWEHFGNSIVLEPLSRSHFATPLDLVKPKVYEIMVSRKIRGVEFAPVNLV